MREKNGKDERPIDISHENFTIPPIASTRRLVLIDVELEAEVVPTSVIDFLFGSLAVTALPTVDDAAVQRAVEEVAAAIAHQETEPRMQHALAHDLGHGEAVS